MDGWMCGCVVPLCWSVPCRRVQGKLAEKRFHEVDQIRAELKQKKEDIRVTKPPEAQAAPTSNLAYLCVCGSVPLSAWRRRRHSRAEACGLPPLA